ncbi:MAG: murein DD-endopeptidase MepM/ murein hydrolase activator NlpD [Mariniblastus sp.]|jgi:murein DD-endopeptidase MepM/ murein hydrolase activator NlpD
MRYTKITRSRVSRASNRAGKKLLASYHALEDRRMLAANIQLVDAFLIDGELNRITSPMHGERIGIQSVWSTTDLPLNADYQIGFKVDGVELFSASISAGAGQASASNFGWYRTGWFASGSLQNVEVVADTHDTVAEDNESDNTLSFSITSQTPDIPQQLIWPMTRSPYSEILVTNYVDVDPTSGIMDYTGRNAAYNGHNAFDTGPGNFQYMDAGEVLFAAADGVVSEIHDGEFDRQFTASSAPANYVIIDHGEGWRTFYWHLRRDSVNVSVGDSISQGDFLGYMGSSGSSTAMHVHFGLTHHGRTVEPMFAEADYFVAPFGNVYDNPFLVESNITNFTTAAHRREGSSQLYTFSQQANQQTSVSGQFAGLEMGDNVQYRWYRPNGSLYSTGSLTQPADYSSSYWLFTRTLPTVPDLGTWRIDFAVNGDVLGQETFVVTVDGAPEMRIQETNGDLVVDNRFTPIDFGERNVNAADPTKTFTVINHGTDLLTLGSVELPSNYYLVEGLAASLQPGNSDTFTIAMDTAVAGFLAGEVRIESNDADESMYNFSVEGYVSSTSDKLILGISERRTEEGNVIVANLRRPGNSAGALAVSLGSNDNSELILPETVTFADGEDYVAFRIQTIDDSTFDGSQIVEVTATATGFNVATNTLEVLDNGNTEARVSERFLTYDNSVFDGDSPGAGTSDDGAIAVGKVPLLPGETATFENYGSFALGINSVVVDIFGIADSASLDSNDFVFRTGNGSTNASFTDLAFAPDVSVRLGEGQLGSDRVTLVFGDSTITKTWLQVTVLANATTGLVGNDVFYFGNAIGETGNDPSNAIVNLADLALTRSNQSGFSTVDSSSVYDFDRDGRVNLVDVALVRQNQSGFSALNLITAPDGTSSSSKIDSGKGSSIKDLSSAPTGLPIVGSNSGNQFMGFRMSYGGTVFDSNFQTKADSKPRREPTGLKGSYQSFDPSSDRQQIGSQDRHEESEKFVVSDSESEQRLEKMSDQDVLLLFSEFKLETVS